MGVVEGIGKHKVLAVNLLVNNDDLASFILLTTVINLTFILKHLKTNSLTLNY